MARRSLPSGYNLAGANYSASVGLDPGRRIYSWEDATMGSGTGGCSIVSSPVYGDTRSLKMTPTNATCRLDAGGGSSLSFTTKAAQKNICFWAYKEPGTAPRAIQLIITADNFSNFSKLSVLIQPVGWQFYVCPRAAFETGGGTGFSWGSTLEKVRWSNNIDLGSSGSYYTVMPTDGSETVYVSGVYVDVPTRPKFLIGFDDFSNHMVVAQAFNIAGGDGVSQNHSFKSFVESYGWKFAFHAQAGNIALGVGSNVMTVDQVDFAFQAGHDVCTQTWYAPVNSDVTNAAATAGTRLLGPHGYGLTSGEPFTCSATNLSVTPTNNANRIIEDQEMARDFLVGNGWTSAKHHFSFQQGGFDAYVLQACKTVSWKTVRGILSSSYMGTGIGYIAGRDSTPDCLFDKVVNMPSSIATDNNALSDATIQDYVDAVISSGGTGTSYCHHFNESVSGPKTKVLLDRLKLREQQGLIDIVTPTQWYNGMLGAR